LLFRFAQKRPWGKLYKQATTLLAQGVVFFHFLPPKFKTGLLFRFAQKRPFGELYKQATTLLAQGAVFFHFLPPQASLADRK
jgi:hypothetical protein